MNQSCFVITTTDYGRPVKPFFIKSRTFGHWTYKFLDIWGIFGQTVSTHFGTASPFTTQIFIWDWDLNLGRKELGI